MCKVFFFFLPAAILVFKIDDLWKQMILNSQHENVHAALGMPSLFNTVQGVHA